MSKSNNDKPFYVDIDKGIASIRCASNNDVLVQYDSMWPPKIFDLANKVCDRMNKEVEVCRPLRNCDVGMTESQVARQKRLFAKAIDFSYVNLMFRSFFVKWAQMPYESEAK